MISRERRAREEAEQALAHERREQRKNETVFWQR